MSPNEEEIPEVEVKETGDPSVPEGLLDIYLALEDSGMTAEEFKEVYGDSQTGNQG